ncbi:MAG: hypothetical protein VB081_06025 [Christensenella sp.]|uniref:hypothetical protein n=1 Tax=Christensenella sp. TaxID=1935934 RepID=UPI002B2073E2|nr:hypothetical protein [Christensenella sp.]MEA5003038.1 hypothetical protein [Christensenella sp.]
METKNNVNTKKKKAIIIISLILCVLLCVSPVAFSHSAYVDENSDGQTVEIKDGPTPLAAGSPQDADQAEQAASPATPVREELTQVTQAVPVNGQPVVRDNNDTVTDPGTPDAPIVVPDQPVTEPNTPVVDPDEPVVDPDAPIVDPDEPAVDPDAPVVDPDAPSGTNTEITLAYAQRVIDGYSACSTDKERQEYFGITNNNFSNDTFRDKLQEMMGAPLPLENNITGQAAYCSDLTLYLHVYFVKDGSARTPVIYATATGAANGSGRWEAWMIYMSGTWYESQKTHEYNGSHQPTGISSFNNRSIPEISAMLNDAAQFLPLGTTPVEAEEPVVEELTVTENAIADVPEAIATPQDLVVPTEPLSDAEPQPADSTPVEPAPAVIPETIILPQEELAAE